MMTPQQRRALKSPCLLACETMLPDYRLVGKMGTYIITVNAGYE